LSELRPASFADDRQVFLEIPATLASVRLARLVAGGVGAEAGLDVDSIEDLRLAVNEACAILLDGGGALDRIRYADMLQIRFDRPGPVLQVSVHRRAATLYTDPSSVSTAILDVTTDQWTFRRSPARVDLAVCLAVGSQ
jgi:hypothetical protein